MKWIEYDYVCNAEKGITLHKKVEHNEENIAIAEKEAVNGEYTITDDGMELSKDTTMPGRLFIQGLVLTENVDYGSEFPQNPVKGQLFFKKV